MKLGALSAIVLGVSLLAAEPALAQKMETNQSLIIKVQARCWTFSDCAAKCRAVWQQYNWSSAEACIRGFPCSQYPRSCR